jgi:hypothetical protein
MPSGNLSAAPPTTMPEVLQNNILPVRGDLLNVRFAQAFTFEFAEALRQHRGGGPLYPADRGQPPDRLRRSST